MKNKELHVFRLQHKYFMINEELVRLQYKYFLTHVYRNKFACSMITVRGRAFLDSCVVLYRYGGGAP